MKASEQMESGYLWTLLQKLYDELDSLATQHRCGCGHLSCNRCADDASASIVLSEASLMLQSSERPEPKPQAAPTPARAAEILSTSFAHIGIICRDGEIEIDLAGQRFDATCSSTEELDALLASADWLGGAHISEGE